MKVAVFNGSPRIGGNTDLLLCEAEKPIEYAGYDIVRFNLNLLNIRPCQDCGGCQDTGICVINDDMNYMEMKNLESLLFNWRAFHQLLVFNGKHHWPDERMER